MLRADVQEHEIRALAARLHAPIFGPKAQRFLLGFLLFVGQLKRPDFGGSGRMVFQEWMSNPRSWHQNTFHMRVALETDPKHVPDLPFVPVCRRPEIGSRIDGRLALLEGHFDPQVLVPVKRQEVVHDCEVAGRLPFAVHPHTLVDGREVVKHPVRLVHFLLEVTEHIVRVLPLDPAGRDSVRGGLQRQRISAKLPPQPVHNASGLNTAVSNHHFQTSSLLLSTVARCRSFRLRSRREGSGGRDVACEPATQLKGLRSLTTAFCKSSNPSSKASGRGGHPGTYASTGRNLSTPCTTL